MRNHRFQIFSVFLLLSIFSAGAASSAETQAKWTTGGRGSGPASTP